MGTSREEAASMRLKDLFPFLDTSLKDKRVEGRVTVMGLDLADDFAAIRRRIGVVFQSTALDRKLSVRRNLRYGGHLQGLRGSELARRVDEMLEVGRLKDRANDTVGELSGGLRRRPPASTPRRGTTSGGSCASRRA